MVNLAYDLIKSKDEVEYKKLFIGTYCDPAKLIYTFDKILVKFYTDKFEHAFYESMDWKKGDKSIFSFERAEKILWIKDTLEDPKADLRMGWDKEKKNYETSRRVAIVKDLYVVIIHLKNSNEAKFMTAYWADKSMSKILGAPKWQA